MPINACRPLSCSPDIYKAAVTCTSCGTPVPICCLKITRAAWDEYVIVKRPGYAIGDSCSGTSATNYCGSLTNSSNLGGNYGVTGCGSRRIALAFWTVNEDCDVLFSVELSGYWSGINNAADTYKPAVTFSGVVPENWYASTLTLWNFDSTESITVDVCAGTETIFPTSDPALMLKATLWVEDLTETLVISEPVVFTKGSGTTICGLPIICEGDPNSWEYPLNAALSWYYEMDTGEVRVMVNCQWATGTSSESAEDFPWSPTWADTPFTIPAVGPDGVSVIGEWRFVKVANCDDPGGCEPYLCYPECVANTCPDDPETVNYSILFWHLECDGGTGEHSGQFDTPTEGSGGTYQAGDWPFTGTPSISCVDGVPTLDNVTLFGVDFDPISMTLECVDGEAVWTHTFVDPAGGGSGGGPGESCLLTIFTNNGGGA